jgi:hypothetical protein
MFINHKYCIYKLLLAYIVKAKNEEINKYKLNSKFEIKIDIDYNENS